MALRRPGTSTEGIELTPYELMFLALARPAGRLEGMSEHQLRMLYLAHREAVLDSGVWPPVYGPAFWRWEPGIPEELRPHEDDEHILPGEDGWDPNIERHEAKRAARQQWLAANGFENPERVV